MEEVINGILIREVETKNIMTKSSLPVGGYSVNPYVDLRSVIEGDNKDYNRKEESSFGEYGYTKQEFEGDELVDVQEESAPDEAIFSPDEVFEEE